MLREPIHGRRIKQEIQKLTSIRTPSPCLNPVRESPGLPTRPSPPTWLSPLPPPFFCCQNLPRTSHFPFTYQIRPSAAAYYCRAPDPEPKTHFEDPNLNVESLRESSDDRRENGGGRSRTLPEERVLLFTCASEDGKCCVYLVWTKHNSQELCREEGRTLCIKRISPFFTEWRDCPPGTLELLKQNPKVFNKLEVYPGDMYDVAMEELRKYGDKVMPPSEQVLPSFPFFSKVANEPEVYLGRGFRVAYEAAMKYGHFPLQVASKLEVYLGHGFRVAYEAAMKYGVGPMMRHFSLQVLPLFPFPFFCKVANKRVVYLEQRFRVAYEEAMEYGVGFMRHHFPLQVALCNTRPLSRKIQLIIASLMFETVRFIASDLIMLQVLLACGIVNH
ncbi:uncharacterized protein LOC115754505 isoform X3 [Rhodamnia argentea]|uniref:Uncharacterized protein LOC115754505 isoform X3 n=1 Tax=Rhodamnia argentea TaxID=178133 RepID=A0ABM3HMJ8_9MYRT|nr:uncharacterized protein LOC115754505 isoform X3 [Rhodamnia argentea]